MVRTLVVPVVALVALSGCLLQEEPATPPPLGQRVCCTLFGPTERPSVVDLSENTPLELGTRFRVRASGRISALRFYRGALDTEERRGTLWSDDGEVLAEATFPARSGEGWQMVSLSSPVNVAGSSELVVSVFSPEGTGVTTPGFFMNKAHAFGPMEAPAHSEERPNGVRKTGSAGFPTEPGGGANYWVDVSFQPTDVDPPELTVHTPEEGASVWGQFEITGALADAESGPFKVEVAVGDAEPVLAQGREAFRFLWDSRQVSDGEHTLRIIGTDRAGNETTVTRVVQVVNAQATVRLDPLVLDQEQARAGQTVTATFSLHGLGGLSTSLSGLTLTAEAPDGTVRPLEALNTPASFTLSPGETRHVAGEWTLTPFDPLGTWQVRAEVQVDGTVQSLSAPLTVVHVVPLGAAVHNGRLFNTEEPQYRDTFLQHFDSLTPEYEMKIAQLQPQEGTYNFAIADALVDFAELHGKQVRGHVLVWHKSLPGWLTGKAWTREALIAVMQDHIATVVGRYKGRIVEWDVVNEAVNDDGSLRQSLWLDVIGPEYIALAFEAAHAEDPDAKLFYNDYGADRINTKSTAIFNLVANLKAQGVPIHGVGLQAHQTPNYNSLQSPMEAVIQRLAEVGLETQVTEMDVKLGAVTGLTLEQKLDVQAQIYGAAAQACQSQPSCTRFTAWGITDKYTWLGHQEMPLLFDTDFQPKPAFETVRQVLGRP